MARPATQFEPNPHVFEPEAVAVRLDGVQKRFGDVIAVVTRADSSLSIVPHQKVPLGLDKTVETTLALSKDQDSEQALRVVVAHYLAGYDVIRIRFPPSSTPNLRTYLREAARRMFVGAEILEESRDELVIQCISSYDDLPAPKVIAHLRDWFPRAGLVGWKFAVDGDRAGAVAQAESQISENRTNACVANGRAYGKGFGLVTGPGRCQHVDELEGLFQALEELALKSPPQS